MRGRGPDGYWIYSDDRTLIGQTLLSITDPDGPIRPYVSDNDRIIGCANGEIYNSAELRESLRPDASGFQSGSDCEVIAHGYARWGDDIFPRLDGMFGIALLDRAARRLTLARDRVGIRPLYYSIQPTYVAFASEPRMLISSGLASREPCEEGLFHSLVLRRPLEPLTMFREVRAVMPGERLTFDSAGRLSSFTFARMPKQALEEEGRAPATTELSALKQVLIRAVERRIPDRSKYGLFLSGGLDSTIVNLLAPKDGVNRLPSMVAGFQSEGMADERVMARTAAELVGVPLISRSVSRESFLTLWPFLVWAAGEPLMFNSAIPLFLLCMEARSMGAKVMLSGEGADEMFAGYHHYPDYLAREDDGTPEYLFDHNPEINSPSFVLSNWIADESWGKRQWGLLRARIGAAVPFQGAQHGLARVLEFDRLTFLRSLLMRQDRVGLTTGIEIRVPFLDHEVLALATTNPANSHLDGGAGKKLLRTAFAPDLTSDFVRVPKVGFPVPIGEWATHPDFQNLVTTLNGQLNRSGFFRKDPLLNLPADTGPQRTGRNRYLWTLSNWAMWWHCRSSPNPPHGLWSDVVPHDAHVRLDHLAGETMRTIDPAPVAEALGRSDSPCYLVSAGWGPLTCTGLKRMPEAVSAT